MAQSQEDLIALPPTTRRSIEVEVRAGRAAHATVTQGRAPR